MLVAKLKTSTASTLRAVADEQREVLRLPLEARVEYLEEFAHGYQRLRDEGIEALVLESHARYLTPAVFDDRLLVHARCRDVRGARFRYEYAIERAGEVIADGWTAHATVDAKTLRPTRVPEWLAAAITSAEAPASSPLSP